MTLAPRAALRVTVVGAGLLAAALLTASPAWAHSQLVSMTPAVGSTVAVAPTEIVLTFDENIQDIGDAVVVRGPDGARVDDGPPVILDATATEKLRPLTFRGHYTVSYRIVSADGHPVERTLTFGLTAGRQAPVVASVVQPAHAQSSGGLSLPWVLLGAALGATLLLGVVRWLLGRRPG